jgi:hypothetical protein
MWTWGEQEVDKLCAHLQLVHLLSLYIQLAYLWFFCWCITVSYTFESSSCDIWLPVMLCTEVMSIRITEKYKCLTFTYSFPLRHLILWAHPPHCLSHTHTHPGPQKSPLPIHMVSKQNCHLPICKKKAKHKWTLTFLDFILVEIISDMMSSDCLWVEMVRDCGKNGEWEGRANGMTDCL